MPARYLHISKEKKGGKKKKKIIKKEGKNVALQNSIATPKL